MGLKTSLVSFSELSQNESIRLWIPFVLPKLKYNYDKLTNNLLLYESGNRPKGGIKNEDEGEAISLGGEQINVDGTIDLSKIPYVSYEFYENTDRGKVKDFDILMCKDGALTGKTCLVDLKIFPSKEIMINEHVFILRGNEKINQKFLFYFTLNSLFQTQIKDLAYRKKAQPGLSAEHLRKIKIPQVPKKIQDQIVSKIEILENKIKELKIQILQDQQIINRVFAREFNFDLEKFEELKKNKHFFLDLSTFANNIDIRQSVKFHRNAGIFVLNSLKKITKKRVKHFISEPIVLGKSVSPSDYDDNGDYYYVSMANIKNWKFESIDSKLVTITYSNQNQNKTIAKNDILMARSGEGTIGKVALIDNEELMGIFSDFTMRLRFINYNPLFAYYYFRTEYFQYLIEINKKGLGNNTNIFPSQIKEFPMLDISLKEQARIVEEIKTEIDSQIIIKNKIKNEIDKINNLIEKVIE